MATGIKDQLDTPEVIKNASGQEVLAFLPERFGPFVPDGVTDCAPALQAAMNAAHDWNEAHPEDRALIWVEGTGTFKFYSCVTVDSTRVGA